MPISSERMLSLIAAAKAFRQSRGDLISTLRATINAIPAEPAPSDLQTAIGEIQLILATFPFPSAAAETIATEETHFKEAKGKNDRARRYQQRKRAGSENKGGNKIIPLPPLSQTKTPPSPAPVPPLSLSRVKPLSAPSDEMLLSLGVSPLSLAKMNANERALEAGLPEPYPDPTNDDEGL